MRVFSTLLLITSLLLSSTGYSEQKYNDQKVVYHMNYHDESRISETMTNIANHIQAVGEEHIEIKVVVHGQAIEYFMDAVNDQAKQISIDSLRLSDVQFIICGNTLDGYKVTREDLYDVEEEDVVQAGLPAIIDLQQRGYIYVRP
ncbi:DsrE family protein [Neptunomonas sp.]|uniref:DsrE family protein n=1 Tax=Neptunomonas sp. TaxID=1971898 RepID=UPI003561677A